MSFKLVNAKVEVPKGTGMEGFIQAVRNILKLPRVQDIQINNKGVISYSHYVLEDDPVQTLDVDFSTVTPAAIIRNVDIDELSCEEGSPATTVLARLFQEAHRAHLVPIAIVVNPRTEFFVWLKKSVGFKFLDNMVFGLPTYFDETLPEETLILAAAYTWSSSLMDTARCYKVSTPKMFNVTNANLPTTNPEHDAVEII